MKTLYIFIISLIFCVHIAEAQNSKEKDKGIYLFGQVMDSFRRISLADISVILMNEDSVIIDSTQTKNKDGYSFYVPAIRGKYIVKASAKGFDDEFLKYEVKGLLRNAFFTLPNIYIHKNVSYNETLNEVVVKASKVQFVWKGDTLVYNADAFNIPEGSMLEDIIKQLPGVELKKNGEIIVNGRKIDFLTLNGKDFFKGKNELILKNLPYFTVKNIKVYDKQTRLGEFLDDNSNKDYVMDVVLKKKYSNSFVGNAEGALGTNDRWMTRLFGLRLSDKMRITSFANMNNVNNNSTTSNGDWSNNSSKDGLKKNKNFNFEIMNNGEDNSWDNTLELNVNIVDKINESVTSSKFLFPDYNVYSVGKCWQRNKSNFISAYNVFNTSTEKSLYFYSSIQLGIEKQEKNSNDKSVRFNSLRDDDALSQLNTDTLLNNSLSYLNLMDNISQNNAKSDGQKQFLRTKNVMFYKCPWGDNIHLEMTANADKTETDNYSHFFLDNINNRDYRNRYDPNNNIEIDWFGKMEYEMRFRSGFKITMSYDYKQISKIKDRDAYRFEKDLAWQALYPQIGLRPDNYSSLLDEDNTVYTNFLMKTHNARVRFYYEIPYTNGYSYLACDLPLSIAHERERYRRNAVDTLVHRYSSYCDADIRYVVKNNASKSYFHVIANTNTTMSDIDNLIGYKDMYNPTRIKKGNKKLKNSHLYKLNIYATKGWTANNLMNGLIIEGGIISNKITPTFTYNQATGTYTVQDVNVNGNWYSLLQHSINLDLTNSRKLRLENVLYYKHSNILYYGIDSKISNIESCANGMRSDIYSENLSFPYRLNDVFSITPSLHLTYEHVRSAKLKKVSNYDLDYGFTLDWTLPLKVHLSADAKMYHIHSNESSMLNDNCLICNISLVRSFLHDKLALKFSAVDIFNEISNNIWNISAEGYTYKWDMSTPRYAMFHLIYKLGKG